MQKWLLLMVFSCLAACAPVNPVTRSAFEAAQLALAANDAFQAAGWLAMVAADDSSPELKKKALETLHNEAFGRQFVDNYIQRLQRMDVVQSVDNTDLLFKMLFINPSLNRQGEAVWDVFCTRLGQAETFSLTARVGERLPCREDPRFAERIYANSVEYLRSNINNDEFAALARFVQTPGLTSYTARLRQDLPDMQLDRAVVSSTPFKEVAGAQAKAITQAAIPGYALKIPQQYASFEKSVRAYLENELDIRRARPNEPNTVIIEVSDINLEQTYSNPIKLRKSYSAGQCSPLVKAKMSSGTEYTFLLTETDRESVFTATVRLGVRGVVTETVPVRYVLKERSIACEDFAIELVSGGRPDRPSYGSVTQYANRRMAALCSRNRDYMSTRKVWGHMAKTLAEGVIRAARTLKKK